MRNSVILLLLIPYVCLAEPQPYRQKEIQRQQQDAANRSQYNKMINNPIYLYKTQIKPQYKLIGSNLVGNSYAVTPNGNITHPMHRPSDPHPYSPITYEEFNRFLNTSPNKQDTIKKLAQQAKQAK